ncbi:MAG TPA: rRNA maturation RNase YbeY [Bacillota bacterium]|nr:rRNA maturation RNase YbeY [Bacillota bacterium]
MPIYLTNMQKAVEATEDLEELIESVVQTTLAEEDANLASEVSVVLVDDPYIHKMNLEYRGIDRPTDVLSFAMLEEDENEPEILGEPDPEPMLGDIIISLETALRQAAEYNHPVEREVAFLTVHGMLHLLGYDHMEEAETKEMRAREEAILALLDLSR